MLKQLSDMPVGVVGFEAIGTFEDDDFEDTVSPVLRNEITAGRPIRLLYLLGEQLKEYEGDALAAQMKFAARHFSSSERVAVLSDQDWLRPALRVLSALVPGQLRAFPLTELGGAKQWLAGPSEQPEVS
jgi:hypothetical protein